MTHVKFTKDFTHRELKCKHCGENKMDNDFLIWLQELREDFGKPMKLTSAYRCPYHNDQVSSTGRDGPHTTGKAVDVLVDRQDAHELIRLAMANGVQGLGVKQHGDSRFIHLDLITEGLRPTVWSYK